MTTVQRWTGRETRALRLALRMSVRGFASTLGVGARTVATWEADGPKVCPRPEMQAALDTALHRADNEAKARFSLFLEPKLAETANLHRERQQSSVRSDQLQPLSRPDEAAEELRQRLASAAAV